MSEQEFIQYTQVIRQQIEQLHRYVKLPPTQQQQATAAMEVAIDALDNLELLQEEIQTGFEAMEVVEAGLFQQNEALAASHQRYCDLFHYAPNAYLLTNAQGIIVEANHAAAALFNVAQKFLVGKPLTNFVSQADRSHFRTKLSQLSQVETVQVWQTSLYPRCGQPFDALLLVSPFRDASGLVSLRIGVHNTTEYKQITQHVPSAISQQSITATAKLPYSLDGLHVLFVDDELDARELITSILESQGIRVTAVASVAEALETLGRFRPDVVISDIRMPHEDGYSLIRKLRILEAEQGWRIPVMALTAYLTEDREKAISAGFESHLHKLAQPTELVEMVTRLSERASIKHREL